MEPPAPPTPGVYTHNVRSGMGHPPNNGTLVLAPSGRYHYSAQRVTKRGRRFESECGTWQANQAGVTLATDHPADFDPHHTLNIYHDSHLNCARLTAVLPASAGLTTCSCFML